MPCTTALLSRSAALLLPVISQLGPQDPKACRVKTVKTVVMVKTGLRDPRAAKARKVLRAHKVLLAQTVVMVKWGSKAREAVLALKALQVNAVRLALWVLWARLVQEANKVRKVLLVPQVLQEP